jgi:hypothetical protein
LQVKVTICGMLRWSARADVERFSNCA